MTKTYLKFRSRIKVISCVIIFSWVGLTVRLFQVQVLNGETYRLRGFKQGQTQEPLSAVRGNIYDRNNTSLTRNIIHYNIGVHPITITEKQKLAKALKEATGRPVDYYLRKLNTKKNFVYLERNLRKSTFNKIPASIVKNLVVERNSRRYYPHGNIAGQLVGFTNVDDQGITGIEERFDKYLRGVPGWVIKQRTGRGNVQPKNNYPVKPPVDGANIQLTIDLEYQSILREELLQRLEETKARSAIGIIMNPQDGAILAMASVPDYDPNNPNRYQTENQKIRAITDQFEPGSTLKIVAATAALALNTVPLDREFNCENGSYQFKDVLINDHEKYGLLTFSQIIEFSSNVGVIKIAETLGEKNLYRFVRDYGFGSPTNISLNGEISGVLRRVSDWSRISLAEVAMGHEVGVTALQLATAYAAIANGGFLIRPRLIQQIIDNNGNVIYADRPEVVRKVASEDVMNTLKQMLVKVVESGTGTNARIAGWSIAGKTGTAQKFIDGSYSNTKFISNFVGFFPAENPQLLGVFVLNEPKYGYHWGGVGAAPLFKRVMERIINMDDDLDVQPPPVQRENAPPHNPIIAENSRPLGSPISAGITTLQTAALYQPDWNRKTITVPEVRGMSLRKAVSLLQQKQLKSKINGSGRVIWQSPPPGTKVPPGSICEIGLK